MRDDPTQLAGSESSTSGMRGLKKGAMSPMLASGMALAAFVPAVSIATVPAYVEGSAANMTWLALLIASLGSTAVAVAVIAFARRFVVSGALYSYIQRVFGPKTTLLTAGSLVLAYLLAIAFILINAIIYLNSFLTGIGITWTTSIWGASLAVAVICALSSFAAYKGIEVSAKLSVILMIATLPLVVLVTVAIPFTFGLDLGSQFSTEDLSISGIMKGVAMGAAVIILFESSTATAFETRDPVRTIPRVVLAVPLGLGLLFVISALLQVPALTTVRAQTEAGVSPISALATLSHMEGLSSLIDLSLTIALISSSIAFVNYGARVVATMGADGTLPKQMAAIHDRYQTPHVAAVWVSGVVATLTIMMLALTNGDVFAVYAFSASLYTFCVVIPYILICVGAVILTLRERVTSVRYLVVTSTLGVVTFAWIFVSALMYPAPSPLNFAPYIFAGLLVLVVGTLAILRKSARTKHDSITDSPSA